LGGAATTTITGAPALARDYAITKTAATPYLSGGRHHAYRRCGAVENVGGVQGKWDGVGALGCLVFFSSLLMSFLFFEL